MRGRPLTPEQRRRIAELRAKGYSREELAARYGVTVQAITDAVVSENKARRLAHVG